MDTHAACTNMDTHAACDTWTGSLAAHDPEFVSLFGGSMHRTRNKGNHVPATVVPSAPYRPTAARTMELSIPVPEARSPPWRSSLGPARYDMTAGPTVSR